MARPLCHQVLLLLHGSDDAQDLREPRQGRELGPLSMRSPQEDIQGEYCTMLSVAEYLTAISLKFILRPTSRMFSLLLPIGQAVNDKLLYPLILLQLQQEPLMLELVVGGSQDIERRSARRLGTVIPVGRERKPPAANATALSRRLRPDLPRLGKEAGPRLPS